jgi:site-specific DNA-methyltransferase (adenine-specific)
VLRDITERVVIASKGRFDRAIRPEKRLELGLPSVATISRDEFLEATTDLWEIPPESATRVGHPAPFPVELPRRLIDLFTYEDDVVLDPFMGSGTTAVAAMRSGRHFIGFDTDTAYVARAKERIKDEASRLATQSNTSSTRIPARSDVGETEAVGAFDRGLRSGLQAKEVAALLLAECGFVDVRSEVKLPGLVLHLVAADQTGAEWAFEVAGAFTSNRAGLKRAETLWRAVGRATVLHQVRPDLPVVLLTTDLPNKGSAGRLSLQAVTGPDRPILDTVALLDDDDQERLRGYALRGRPAS